MTRRVLALSTLVVLGLAPRAQSQGVVIDHKEVGCIVVGKYPKMNACFSPAANVARSRVYFRPEGTPSWYYVDMKSDQPCFAGVLPRPGKKLVGKKIEYYVEAQDKTFNPARTAEYGPVVVNSAQECKKEAPVAPFVNNATVAVFPALPAGFVGGGLGTAAVVGIAAAGAAAAGTAAVVASGDDSTTTTTIVAGVNTTTTIVAATTTTTTTQPRANNRAPFAVLATKPDPPSGGSPLTVQFDLCKSTDPDGDSLSYFFDFGDGSKTSGSCLESHTYTASFRAAGNVGKLDQSFSAEGCVVDPGGLSSCRTRTVNVTGPPPTTAPCPGGPTVRLSPPPSLTSGCPATIPVRASTTNADGVTFCATDTGTGCFFRAPEASAAALPPTCVAGVRSGTQFSANLNLGNGSGCFDITVQAQGCGGTANDGPERVVSFGCDFRGESRDDGSRGAAWSSDLTVAGGRLQLVVNGAPPAFPGRGAATGLAGLVAGQNRVEAVLVETAGKAGLWRVEFMPADAIVGGSLRVISGDVVLLGPASATFRLSGQPGERIVFTFVKR